MSAENAMRIYRMANGEVWIGTYATGDTVLECQNEFAGVVAKCATYEEAMAKMDILDDPESDSYVYTEYGASRPSPEEFERSPTHFLVSWVMVAFGDRPCGCLDGRDVPIDQWKVIERDEGSDLCWDDDAAVRVLHANISFAQALTFAQLYAKAQPGEVSFMAPTHFMRFPHYPEHECYAWDNVSDLPDR